VNTYLRRWIGYFALAETPSVVEQLDEWLRRRLRLWLVAAVATNSHTAPGTARIEDTGSGSAPTGTGFSIGVAGNHTMQDPLLLIFAEPTGTLAPITVGFNNPACPTSTGCPAATIGDYGLTADTKTVTGAGTDLYQALGLTESGAGTASVTVGNLDLASSLQMPPLPDGGTYTLDAFGIPVSLTGKQGISVSEAGAPAGTFVFAYSCETSSTPPLGPCVDPGVVGATPMTNVGILTTSSSSGPPPPPPPTSVPEPMTLPVAGVVVGALLAAWSTRRGA
jgi:hypothetical protein